MTFERELNETWIVLTGETTAPEHACRFLERTPCRHLLRLSRRDEGEGTTYAYAISGGKSLAGMFQLRPMSFAELRRLILGISAAVEEAEECLLDLDSLLLEPELIFGVPDLDHLRLCCHPGVKRDFFLQMRELVRYCLQKIDHQDVRGTETAYALFEICEQEYWRFEDLLGIVGRAYAAEQQKPVERQEEQAEETKPQVPVREIPPVREAGPEKARSFDLRILLAALLLMSGMASAGLGLLVRKRAGVWVWRPFAAAMLLLFAGAFLLWRILACRADQRPLLRFRKSPHGGAESAGTGMPDPAGSGSLTGAAGGLRETTFLGEPSGEHFRQLTPSKKGKGDAALLRHYPFVIGKLHGEADLVLDDPAISRVHARLEQTESGYCILDCHSTNGTWVNGVRLTADTPYPLQPGDELRFADVKYRFH